MEQTDRSGLGPGWKRMKELMGARGGGGGKGQPSSYHSMFRREGFQEAASPSQDTDVVGLYASGRLRGAALVSSVSVSVCWRGRRSLRRDWALSPFGGACFNVLCPPPGPFLPPAGQPAPPGPPASRAKSQSLDPFADLGDLSSSLQGEVQGGLGVHRADWRCAGQIGGAQGRIGGAQGGAGAQC